MASAMLMCRGVESIGLLVLVHVSANAKGGERVIAQTAAIMNHNEVLIQLHQHYSLSLFECDGRSYLSSSVLVLTDVVRITPPPRAPRTLLLTLLEAFRQYLAQLRSNTTCCLFICDIDARNIGCR